MKALGMKWVLSAAAAIILNAQFCSATTLSGLIEFSTDGSGNFYNGSVWNTRGGDTAVNLWVIRGTNLQGVFVNGPSDSQAGIAIPLSDGEHTFLLYANQGGSTPHHGLNLFFNGNNNAPRISVFGPTQISADPPYPAFLANGGSTLTLGFAPIAGANTLVFQDTTARIELIDYRFADYTVYGTDRVSQRSTSPDGGADFIGQFTLRITNARPEPDPNRTVFDLSQDFSVTSNPAGPWSYGWASALNGSFTPFPLVFQGPSQNGVPVTFWAKNNFEPAVVYFNHSSETSISDNGQGVFPPGAVWFYAGPEGHLDNYSVIRFVAPSNGTYQLEAAVRAFMDGDRSGDTDFHVLKNGTELFGEFLPPRTGTGYSNTLGLAAGDAVDFAVGRGEDGILYGSGLKIQARLERVSDGPPPPTPVITLSGLIEFSTDPNGNFFNGSVWNTRGGDTAVNLWVIRGADRLGPFVNGPSDAQAGISIGLSEGDHTFTIFGNQGGPTPHHGLNLFFNGDTANPRISVFGATQTSADPPFPPFSASSSSSTLTLAFQPVAGAGTLVFQEGDTKVELIDYRWAAPSVYNIDRVSQPVIAPDGTTDFIGQFTLRVSKVPVEATIPKLTGLIEFSTDPDGNFFNGSVWNTRGGDTAVNLWVSRGSGLGAPFVNGPSDAEAGINIQLHPGANNFVIYGNQGGPTPNHGLNLFFNGDDANPAISVFGPTQTSQTPPFPPFAANTSPSTLTLEFQPVAGAGTLVYQQGDIRVELTDYRWADPFAYDIDRVSQPVATPDGGPDFIGHFTLMVKVGPKGPHIGLSPQFPIDGAPHPFVIACDGRGAQITLDARDSTDPEGDALSYAWFAGSSQTPFSMADVVTTVADIGVFSVTLRVSDAQSSASTAVTFEVITPAEAAAQLSLLLDAADLARKNVGPLRESIGAAIHSLERGKIATGINQLEAFENKVKAQLESDHPGLAASLIGATEALIEALGNCAPSDH